MLQSKVLEGESLLAVGDFNSSFTAQSQVNEYGNTLGAKHHVGWLKIAVGIRAKLTKLCSVGGCEWSRCIFLVAMKR